jgi:hypothetical protein
VFTVTAVVAQPITGAALAALDGHATSLIKRDFIRVKTPVYPRTRTASYLEGGRPIRSNRPAIIRHE